MWRTAASSRASSRAASAGRRALRPLILRRAARDRELPAATGEDHGQRGELDAGGDREHGRIAAEEIACDAVERGPERRAQLDDGAGDAVDRAERGRAELAAHDDGRQRRDLPEA